MRERNQQMEQRILELEAIVENQNIEIGHMGHALDMQAELYGVQGNLLYELSKNQRENEMLRNDLSQKEEVIHNMAHDIDSFQHSMNELVGLRQSLEAELMQKTEEVRSIPHIIFFHYFSHNLFFPVGSVTYCEKNSIF